MQVVLIPTPSASLVPDSFSLVKRIFNFDSVHQDLGASIIDKEKGGIGNRNNYTFIHVLLHNFTCDAWQVQ